MANVIWNPNINATNPTVELVVTQQSQSVDGNYSTLAYSLILHRPMNVTSSASKSYSVSINGVTVASGATTIGGSGDKIIASGTTVVYHNSDGTKTGVPFSFYMDIGITWSGSATGNASGSGSINLTPIPRASTGSLSNASPNLGDTITITIARASTAFTHHVYHDWYAGTWTKITTGGAVATSLTWTVPKSFANAIPSSTSGTGRIAIDTFNGATFIGTTILNFTGNVPDTAEFRPTITAVTKSEATAGIATQFGAYVQNKSTLAVAVTAVKAYGSPIVEYKTTILGENYFGESFTSKVLSSSGSVAIKATVKDARGRSFEFTPNPTVTVVPYSSPTVTTFKGFRATNTGVQDDDEGTYLRVVMKFNISPVNVGGVDKNTKSYKVEYKLQSAGTWTQLTTGNVFSYDSAFTSVSSILSLDYAYDVRLTLTDFFGSIPISFPVSKAFTLVDYASDGKSMAIGKVAEGLAMLEVFGDVLIQNTGNDTKLKLEQLQGNAGIEVGSPTFAGTGYVDFRTSGNNNDYDSRLYGYGGGTQNYQGVMGLRAGIVEIDAPTIRFMSNPKVNGHGIWYDGIIEQGQNSSGKYIKYPDGTMIAYNRVAYGSMSITSAWGSWFITSAISVSFPATFYDNPCVAVNMENSSGDIATWMNASVSTTGFSGRFTRGQSATISAIYGWIAIGRWK